MSNKAKKDISPTATGAGKVVRQYRIIHVWHNPPDFGAAFKIEGGEKDGCQSQNRFESKAAALRAARLYLDGTPLDDIDGAGYREPRQ